MEQYQQVFDFVAMTHKLRQVERMCHYAHTDRLENDLEHSGQLALVCRTIMDKMALDLNTEKVFKYALCHDLIEVYAGDTNPFDPEAVKTKDRREHESLLRLKEQFGANTDMFTMIEEYHTRSCDEAKFVYAVDKLIPEFNIFLAQGKTYQKYRINREALVSHMHKAYIYEPLRTMTDDLIAELYRHDEWFL